MTAGRKIKYYIMSIGAFLCLLAPLLPWMSYGVGSKTGIDISDSLLYTLYISAFLLFLFSYIASKMKTEQKFILYFSLICALVLLGIFSFEIIRIEYQTVIAKSLPVEMFGMATIPADKIHIGYGLWLGGIVSLLVCIVNIIAIKVTKAVE